MPARLNTRTSLVITRKDLIQRRREQVYELHWKGMSSREIGKTLNCSFKTVCNDIAWLEKNATQEIHEQRKHIALEYKAARTILYYLRGRALEQFDKPNEDEDRKLALYSIIESLNANILALLAAGDIIDEEMLEYTQQQATAVEEELKTLATHKRAYDKN